LDTPRRKVFVVWILGLVLLFATQPAQAEQVSKYEWSGIDRIVAIGDVHGSYDKFVTLLHGTGLVDESLTWTGGNAHLVMLGDLVDRGRDDRKVIELVMRLQDEAGASGGQVHALLGNHDVMVLIKDLRYVEKKSYAAFAPDERPEDREKAWKGYASAYSASGISGPKLKAAFDDTYPPGFFAYSRMFDLEGPFGSWSLARPVIIKINGIVFVHGGLTDEVASRGLEDINREIYEDIREFTKSSQTLEPLVKGPATFEEIVKTAYEIQKGASEGRVNRQQEEASRKLIRLLDSMLLAPNGAIWYRGNSLENERLERRRIDDVLNRLQANALVVGHTPTADGRVTSRFNARVYRTDVGLGYGHEPYCLELEGNEVESYDPQAMSYQSPSPEIPRGQQWTNIHPQATDRQLEDFLKTAKLGAITRGKIQDREVDLVELEKDGLQLRALFICFEEKPPQGKKENEVRLRRYEHEVAAYWLDRRLKLRMVPVTVVRKIDGRMGALQIMIESAVDRVWIEEQNLLERGREELRDEIDKAWVLEAVLDVEKRVKEGQMFLPEERRIMLSGSTLAFSHFPEIQKEALPHLNCPINPALENELTTLSREELEQNLSGYLSDGQIDALLKRRDRVLELGAKNDR
jgi:Calcineurin-like phosphoesterase